MATVSTDNGGMKSRLLELDCSIREALQNHDGETVIRLSRQHDECVRSVLDAEGKDREAFARMASELLARNIELALRIRENLQVELRQVIDQRKLSGVPPVAGVSTVGRSFCA